MSRDQGVSELLASLETELRLARKGSDGSRMQCTQRSYKVLPNMRHSNSSDYEPIFFRFGLYNFRLPDPCYHYKIEIALQLTTESSFEELVTTLVGRMGDIRKVYSDGGDMQYASEQPHEVALILALDGLTVVAAALYQEHVRPRSMCTVIWRDTLLLEQQLPLFVLQAAIDSIVLGVDFSSASSAWSGLSASDDGAVVTVSHLCPESASSRPHIHDLVTFYALVFYPFIRNLQVQREHFHSPIAPRDMQMSLLTHIHTTFIHAHPVHRYAVVSTQFTCLPTASELLRFGIRFCVGDGGFTGISFDKKSRVLTLPEITVFSTSKSYLLNLVAQEAAVSWYDDDPCPVSSYILLMGFLINSQEDVKPLVDAQVLQNHLGSHAELAKMWTSLGINLPISLTQEDSNVINAVREACDVQTLRNRALHHQRNKPWLLMKSISSLCRCR